MPSPAALQPLTTDDVMRDLETGRSLPLHPAGLLRTLPATDRATIGGRQFLRTSLAARALGRIHPRLARRWLLRLWFTPWVHPSALAPVTLPDAEFLPWSLDAAGTTLQGYTGGVGPTVVMVHGWAGRAADWRHLAADLLAEGWRVVVPDLPAHGRTEGERSDIFEMGRALARVLDHEQPVAVVTHSMGFPTTLRAVEEGAAAPELLVALAPGRSMTRAVEGFGRQSGLAPTLVEELRRGIEDRYGADVWGVLDVERLLPRLPSAGLVIHDVDDTEVPLADARAITARWPGAELTTTAGLGHRRILRDEGVRQAVVDALG